MNPLKWLRLVWAESRIGRYASGIHQLQAEDLRLRTRRHVHDVSDAIFAARAVAIELENILEGMRGERRDDAGTVDGSGTPPAEPGSE